jgi:hypothetical protein
MYLRVVTAAALLTAFAGSANAQQSVQLQFNAGQVTLSAQNAPVRAILAEWAKLGGATIVNGDRVAGPPVTLELAGVPERQALDIVLRSVAGYIVAPRPAGSSGASTFNRIVILPTSVAPRNPPPATTAAGGRPPTQARPNPIARPPEVPDTNVDVGNDNPDPLEDPSALVQGRDPRVVQPPFVMRPPVQQIDTGDVDADEPQKENAPAGVPPSASNPFGVPLGSSATPGVISPAPKPQQQQQQQPRPTRVPPNRVQ